MPPKFNRDAAWTYHLRNPTAPELAAERALSRMGWGRYRFQYPIGRYFADFALLDLSVVLEVDGASHSKPGAAEADRAREVEMERRGWVTVRMSNEEALGAGCTDTLRARVEAVLAVGPRPVHEPTPRPARRGGRGRKPRKPPTP